MAQNVTINGVAYSDVPAIVVPKTGGGTARFIDKAAVTWHQCPQAVRNYLDNVTYDPSDYSSSQITSYAPSPAVQSNTKPIGETVDGITYYNEVPNVATPFSSTNTAGTLTPLDRLRWINSATANMRDLGGWTCDGGTVKYGKLYRCAAPVAADRSLLVNQLGIHCEIDLRDTETHSAVLGDDVEYVDVNGSDIVYTINSGVNVWKQILSTVFNKAIHNEPLLFHCSAGRDRTGTVACIIEAILGVSQSDIDKDYELTSFYVWIGTNSDPVRTKMSWSGTGGLIPMIVAKSGSTFRDKVINWVASLGFTATEINAFRTAMIDGTPATVSPSITTYSIANNLTGIINNNAAVSIAKGNAYYAELTADTGYSYDDASLNVGGASAKADYYKQLSYPSAMGIINIPSVDGNVVITSTGTLQNPYQICEYIATTAHKSGAYVDTLYTNTEHTGIECLIQYIRTSTQGQGLIGNTDFYIGCSTSADMRAFKGGVKSFQLTNSVVADTDYNVSLNIADTGKAYINGTEKSWNSGTPTYAKSNTITLFKCNGISGGYGYTGYARIYSAAIYEAGVKVRDMKPCYRTADGVCGMYDILNDVFYPGTGTFTKGADVNS